MSNYLERYGAYDTRLLEEGCVALSYGRKGKKLILGGQAI